MKSFLIAAVWKVIIIIAENLDDGNEACSSDISQGILYLTHKAEAFDSKVEITIISVLPQQTNHSQIQARNNKVPSLIK